MSLLFSQLQAEVARRATRDQGGTTFTTPIKTIINTSLFRLGREAPWRPMRRKSVFNTLAAYSTGSGAGTFTNGSATITVTGATFITDNIQIGRRIKLAGDSRYHIIQTITSETSLTIETAYSGTTTTTGTYGILGQEEYNLPVQAGHRMFIWHERFGYPFQMKYLTDQEFYNGNYQINQENIPMRYRMWGNDTVINQVRNPSVVTVVSSSTSDVSIPITVFGNVSGYPDYEIINTNGTTSVNGTKVFSYIERVSKSSSTIGRITATANSGTQTISVLPVGDTTATIFYKKVQIWPLPNAAFPINVQYYKDPYRLVNAGDIHEFGQDFDEALILMATAKIKAESNLNSEADRFLALYADEVNNLRKTNVDKIDWFPKLKRPNEPVFPYVHSNLAYAQIGAFFGPQTSW